MKGEKVMAGFVGMARKLVCVCIRVRAYDVCMCRYVRMNGWMYWKDQRDLGVLGERKNNRKKTFKHLEIVLKVYCPRSKI